MILTRTLFFYIVKNFISSFLLITGLVSASIFFANIFDILNRMKAKIIPFSDIIYLAILKLPYLINELLPLCMLLGSLFFIERLSKRNELIIIFSGGISIWKFIQPLILVVTAITIISITIFQPISAYCLMKQEWFEKRLINNRVINTVSLSDGGFYISEQIDNQHRIYTAKTITPETFMLSNMTVLIFDQQSSFLRRIDSKTALLKNNQIEMLNGVNIVDSNGNTTSKPSIFLNTNLEFKNILDRFASPENISFWNLAGLSWKLTNSGINADKFINYYYKLLFRPVYSIAVILVAASFINLNPRGRIGFKAIGIGAIFGLIIHSYKEIMTAFLIANSFSFGLAQLIPAIIIIFIATLVILHKFES